MEKVLLATWWKLRKYQKCFCWALAKKTCKYRDFATRGKNIVNTVVLGFRGAKKHRYLRCFLQVSQQKSENATYLTIFWSLQDSEKTAGVTTTTTTTTNNKQQTTNNKQQTTNNKQQTTNKKQETTNNKQQTTNNKQQPTTNNQQQSKRATLWATTATLRASPVCKAHKKKKHINIHIHMRQIS